MPPYHHFQTLNLAPSKPKSTHAWVKCNNFVALVCHAFLPVRENGKPSSLHLVAVLNTHLGLAHLRRMLVPRNRRIPCAIAVITIVEFDCLETVSDRAKLAIFTMKAMGIKIAFCLMWQGASFTTGEVGLHNCIQVLASQSDHWLW